MTAGAGEGGARPDTLIRAADPREIDVLELGRDPYVDALYGCFRCDNPRGERFRAERTLELVPGSGRRVTVRVPESMRVPLPEDAKLPGTGILRLEELGERLDVMQLLTLRSGWNQTAGDIRRVVGFDPSGSFVVCVDGAGFRLPVATAADVPLGREGSWTSMVLVQPELRRQGIASFVVQACLQHALERGATVIGLDATPMGREVYCALGYVPAGRIWRAGFPLRQFAGLRWDAARVRRMEGRDMSDVTLYDAERFMERGAVLRALHAGSPGNCFVWRSDRGEVEGYCCARPGRLRAHVGPLVAEREEVARSLLTAAAQALLAGGWDSAFIDSPEARFVDRGSGDEDLPRGHRLIAELTPVREFTRMYHCVNDARAESLTRAFAARESLSAGDSRCAEFSRIMSAAVANCARTETFLERQSRELEASCWAISGPEKG